MSGKTLVYYAYDEAPAIAAAHAVTNQNIREILAPPPTNSDTLSLYSSSLSSSGSTRKIGPSVYLAWPYRQIWPAPDGRFAVTLWPAIDAPSEWADYRVRDYAQFSFSPERRRSDPTSKDLSFRHRYVLIDLRTGVLRPLIDAPTGFFSNNGTPRKVFWSTDSKSVIVSNTYLSLIGVRPEERVLRTRYPATVEVNIETQSLNLVLRESGLSDEDALQNKRMAFRIDDLSFDGARLTALRTSRNPQSDALEQHSDRYQKTGDTWRLLDTRLAKKGPAAPFLKSGLNERPKIFEITSMGPEVIFDPNPQAERYSFGRVEAIEWTDPAYQVRWKGSVTYPPGHKLGQKHPLIVQTHGFNPTEFLTDGPDGSSSAMAAQPLANAGFVVLQVEDNSQAMSDRANEVDRFVEGYRAGIAHLVQRGLVDEANIGIIGWSRTGLYTAMLIAKYPKLMKAATIADSVQPGYLTTNLLLLGQGPDVYGDIAGLSVTRPGSPLQDYVADPFYNLAKTETAVRLEADTGDNGRPDALPMWETFAVLKRAGRKVDFVVFPDGSHSQMMPRERLESQGGNVDWFSYWLMGKRSKSIATTTDYARWDALGSRQ